MTTSGVSVVCAAGELDRSAVDELRGLLLARLCLCVKGAAIICDLSQARVFEPTLVTRMLSGTAVRAAGLVVCLFVLPCPGLRRPSTATLSTSGAVGTFALLDDIDSGLRRTGDPGLERDDRQVRRVLDRTIRHCLRDLRGQPPYDTLDAATRQALRWRLTDAAHAGVGVGPGLLSAAAGIRRALTSLNARQHRDAYFALLDAEDHLTGRVEPTLPESPRSAVPPSVPTPRVASTREWQAASGPQGGTRRRTSIPRQQVVRRPQPTGGSR
ncbi:hypothetical protein ACFPK1_08430 [Actinomycetospora rhizophila]|uniref:Uncharacterized protein n=1 Tax=Actinomycetospora rhizophila TaxID=1416876 RepID=A0ABV9ZD49_9PSEU